MRSANLTHAETSARAAAVKVHRYWVEVDLRDASDPARAEFPVQVRIDLTCDSRETWLDFVGEVDQLSIDGVPQVIEHDGARLRLVGLPKRRASVSVAGRARYSHTAEGLHRFVDPADGEVYLYSQSEPADARRIFPCLEQPDLRAPFAISLIGPEGWELLANEADPIRRAVAPGVVRVDFPPSKPMSTYHVALAGGPFHRVDAVHRALGLALLCRRSQAAHLDAEELLRITTAALDWFVDTFDAVPWGTKYDQLFIPEANLASMDHPGLTTLTETFLFRGRPTAAERQARASLIVHQLSHMWFGQLVTCSWWGDLWLKEAVAEFMGTHVAAVACGFPDGWVDFASAGKAAAYVADSGPTTHPVVAEVADLEAARSNFDHITYSKGAAVLTQLVHYVGLESFLRGMRRFFAEHAYASASFVDFIEAMVLETDPHLGEWVEHWLQSAGHDTLSVFSHASHGVVDLLAVQRDHFGPGLAAARRPHRTTVGLYRLVDGRLRLQARFPVTVDAVQVELAAACGLPEPDAILVNDLDLTFARAGLDDRTRETLLVHLGDLEPVTRAVAWNALWVEVRAGQLASSRFVATVLGSGEQHSGLLEAQLRRCLTCVDSYGADPRAWVDGARARLRSAEPGSEGQALWTRAYLRSAPLAGEDVGWLLADGVAGLALDIDLSWQAREAQAAQGLVGEAELAAPQRADDTAAGRAAWARCLAARPDAAVKEGCWERLHTVGGATGETVDALLAGFNALGQDALRAPFAERYFAGLRETWARHPLEIALRLVRGLFPRGGSAAAHRWLQRHPDAPETLRRLLREAAFEDEIAGLARRAESSG